MTTVARGFERTRAMGSNGTVESDGAVVGREFWRIQMDTVGNQVRIRAAVVREKKDPFVSRSFSWTTAFDPTKSSFASWRPESARPMRTRETRSMPSHYLWFSDTKAQASSRRWATRSPAFAAATAWSCLYPACGHCAACLQGQPAYCISSFPLAFGGPVWMARPRSRATCPAARPRRSTGTSSRSPRSQRLPLLPNATSSRSRIVSPSS